MKFKPFEIPIRIESLAEAKILKMILEAQGTLFKTIIEDIIKEVEKRNLRIDDRKSFTLCNSRSGGSGRHHADNRPNGFRSDENSGGYAEKANQKTGHRLSAPFGNVFLSKKNPNDVW